MAGRKLFLADDSLTIQKVINLTFADEGIEVLTAGDGETALQQIPDEMPDIVLADVNMPGLTGYELCELLRGDDRTCHIPVILLVGAFEQFDETEASRVGATAHLTKPFQSIRQLVNQVTDLIRAGRTDPESEPLEAFATEPRAEPVPEREPEPTPEPAQMVHSPTSPFDEPVGSRLETFREDRIAGIGHDSEAAITETGGSGSGEPPTEPFPAEADDIDRLYRQSIGEEPLPADHEFPDLGVDDEMIETSYRASEPDGGDLGLLESGTSDRNTQFKEPQPMAAGESGAVRPDSPYETTELELADLPPVENVSAQTVVGDTVRLDPALVEAQMAETNRRFEQNEQPIPSAGAPIGEETIRMETRFDTRGSGDYELEDIELLDIPTGVEVSVAAPADAASLGGKQVVTLSPEVIEMIAQRVVEKLAEKH